MRKALILHTSWAVLVWIPLMCMACLKAIGAHVSVRLRAWASTLLTCLAHVCTPTVMLHPLIPQMFTALARRSGTTTTTTTKPPVQQPHPPNTRPSHTHPTPEQQLLPHIPHCTQTAEHAPCQPHCTPSLPHQPRAQLSTATTTLTFAPPPTPEGTPQASSATATAAAVEQPHHTASPPLHSTEHSMVSSSDASIDGQSLMAACTRADSVVLAKQV